MGTINYKEVLHEIRESNKEWAIVNMYDVKVLKDEDERYFFDIESWEKACWIEAGLHPEGLAIEAAQQYEMEEIDREGYWNITHLLKISPPDYFEGRLVEQSYLYIVYTEAAFICTLEEREKQEKDFSEMCKNFPFG